MQTEHILRLELWEKMLIEEGLRQMKDAGKANSREAQQLLSNIHRAEDVTITVLSRNL